MIYFKYIYNDKTCHDKINNIFTNFLNKTNDQTWIAEVDKCLYFGMEGVLVNGRAHARGGAWSAVWVAIRQLEMQAIDGNANASS